MDEQLTPSILRKLKKKGQSDVVIARQFGVGVPTVRKMREANDIAPLAKRPSGHKREEHENRYWDLLPVAQDLRNQGYTFTQIGQQIGVNPSTIRGWLKQKAFRGHKWDYETMVGMTYEFVIWYKFHNQGNTPTAQEIADGIGSAPSTVHFYLRELAKRRRIVINKNSNLVRIEIPGSQWIPPTDIKVPSTPRSKPRVYTPRLIDRNKLAKEGRLCDCGNEAKWYVIIHLGTAIGRGGRADTLPLCDDCADYEREQGTEVLAL